MAFLTPEKALLLGAALNPRGRGVLDVAMLQQQIQQGKQQSALNDLKMQLEQERLKTAQAPALLAQQIGAPTVQPQQPLSPGLLGIPSEFTSQTQGPYMTPQQNQSAMRENLFRIDPRLATKGLFPAPPKQTAAIQEYEFAEQLRKQSPEKYERFLRIKRADPSAKVIDQGDRILVTNSQGQLLDQIPKTIPPTQQPEFIKQREAAKKIGMGAGETEAAKPKSIASLSAKEAKVTLLNDLIDEAKNSASGWTTGVIGNIGSYVPGTPQYDLAKTLDTIKANVGFDKLQEMRDTSPTGGALGQVAVRELEFLQSVMGSLDQAQSPTQFKSRLELVRKQVKESWDRVEKAYEETYGEPYKGVSKPIIEGQTIVNPQTGERRIFRSGQWQPL